MPKILIFEDDKFLQAMYLSKYKLEGIEVVGYDNPTKNPVEIVLKERPDIISMDVMMPLMNGFEATALIKADPRTKAIPLFFLTSLGQADDVQAGKALGGVEYMIKSHLTPSEVVDKVREILGLPISRRTEEASPDASRPPIQAHSVPVSTPATQPSRKIGTPSTSSNNRLGARLWFVVLILLIVHPALSIRSLLGFYHSPWSVVIMLLTFFSIVTGLQLLNRQSSALRNVKLFLVIYTFYTIGRFFWLDAGDDLWANVGTALLRVSLVTSFWWLALCSNHGRRLFPESPLPKRAWRARLRRLVVGNVIGQLFVCSVIALLIVAVVTTPAPSPADGLPKKDTAQQVAADAWLEDHPNTLKQLMQQPTGVRPSVRIDPAVGAPLDAAMLYQQNIAAVVFISTNQGFGTGFLLTADGVIATSQHILDGANDAVVMMKSGELFPIRSILACTKDQDFCLLKIDVKNAPFVSLSDSTVAIGDAVAVLGHPQGYDFSLSTGVVSGIHEYDRVGTMFQLTAPTSPGNSGGPVMNNRGQVIGVIESAFNTPDAQNLNFALAMQSVRAYFQFPK